MGIKKEDILIIVAGICITAGLILCIFPNLLWDHSSHTPEKILPMMEVEAQWNETVVGKKIEYTQMPDCSWREIPLIHTIEGNGDDRGWSTTGTDWYYTKFPIGEVIVHNYTKWVYIDEYFNEVYLAE